MATRKFELLTLANENVRLWFERWQHYTSANDLLEEVADDDAVLVKSAKHRKNASVLCSLLDAQTYALLK